MELLWTLEATLDRDRIYSYIEADNPAAALALDELFAEKTSHLIDYPGMGKLGRVTGTLELVVERNYILIYDVEDERVRVLRILHASMQWPPSRVG
ncbi:MAG: type II toxin-antitoxin system RelE/ParE family toxin [Desulfuromonadaceae bacterium]|jgi:addiction module RelE/StbE family toxin|nr:type II toxin-antitoxin system RelE/ParE family toxin [Desulfuromonas sp.]MDY0213504.1 type II toxin-antitoxin system RelE/ParE family toxin [Desulfuromonadaceae bacterium]